MSDSRPGSSSGLLSERLLEAQTRLSALRETDPEYGAKQMIAQSRLGNLEQLREDESEMGELRWQNEEGLKALQDKDELASSAATAVTQESPTSSIDAPPLSSGPVFHGARSYSMSGNQPMSNGLESGANLLAPVSNWDFRAVGENTGGSVTPNGSEGVAWTTSASVSSPETAFTVPQKRQRDSADSHSRSPHDRLKTSRSSASPPQTGLASPASRKSFDSADAIPEELFGLFGGDPRVAAQELKESRLEQENYERMMAERREQERKDAEFALALQNEENLARSQAGSDRPSSARQLSTQTYFDPYGTYNAPQTQGSSSSLRISDPFASGSGFPALDNQLEAPSASLPTGFGLDAGPQYNSVGQQQDVANEFITITSDDDDDYRITLPPILSQSSDVYEVDQAGRPILHQGSSNTPNVGSNYEYQVTAPALNVWDNARNTMQNIYDSAASLVYPTVNGNIGGMGGTSVYGGNAAGTSSWGPTMTLSDSDDEESGLGSMYQRGLNRLGINQQDPLNREMIERYRDRYEYIAQDPRRTAAEIKELLENIRPDEDLPPEDREGTPDAMTYPLMEHQKLGLAWMRRMEEGTNRGGILADDMGLGKTIQALALIASRRSKNPQCKTTLIVAPVALLKQWEREIQMKLKTGREHKMSVFILHGSSRHATWEKLKTFDVVLTTFGILATEVKLQEGIARNKGANPNWRPTGKGDKLCLLGDECHWYRIVIDEAQCIKNKNTRAAIGACRLKADTRFCMTGTPMMNNVGELFSLIHFLRIKPYCEEKKFGHDIGRPLRSQMPNTRNKAMRQLQALLKSILLRRTKKSQIDGKPILNLPERVTNTQHAMFSEDEASFYRALESRSQLQFNKYLRAGTVGRHYSNILVLLLRLRQACCHPHLIKDFGQAGGPSDLSPEQMVEFAKELEPDVVARIKEQAASSEYTSLECPICMDMADNATIFIPCGHDTCSECFARISDPSLAIAEGNFAERPPDTKCPSCRGKVNPAKVIDFNSFKKVHMPEFSEDVDGDGNDEQETETSEEDESTTDDSDDDSEEDEEADSKGNLKNFIVDDDAEESTDDESREAQDDDEFVIKAEKADGIQNLQKIKRRKSKGKRKGKAKEKQPAKTLAQLKKAAGSSARARRKYLEKLEEDWEPSAKIERTLEILRETQSRVDPQTRQTEKTIIFSQFTSLLDLLELPINKEGWDYRRYDGSMSPRARNDAVIDFTDKPQCKIMLVSLKAGNAGLNLVAASQVIVFDPFWNPYIEEQAIDRAHRIGQQRRVQVHRMLVPNTVEDRILALQEKKRELIENALDENASKSIGRLGTRELAFLFDVAPPPE